MNVGMGWTRYDPDKLSLGVFFVGLAIVTAIFLLPGAKHSASAVLYVLVLGGLFVGVPAALGIFIIIHQLQLRNDRRAG
jgi:hypothetical protein